MTARTPRWTISALTIPSREEYLCQLLESVGTAGLAQRAAISIVYNWDTRESPMEVEARLRRRFRALSVDIAFNATSPTIASGRQAQLNACRTPLICMIDDDLTVEGDLLGTLEHGLTGAPLGIAGIPSLVEDTAERFKPRESTPSVTDGDLRYMSIQGMCIGSYRRLLLDIGGFNLRRAFWGEWTELNLRMWRNGFPTAYVMDGAQLRHWHKAPMSPTRNRPGRELDVLWGLMCTALEYDAVDINDDTQSFWDLVATRYLAYAFGPDVAPQELLSAMLRLTPRLAAEHASIQRWRDRAAKHPFPFAPFARITPENVEAIRAYANGHIASYRADARLTASTGQRVPPSLAGRFHRLRERVAALRS